MKNGKYVTPDTKVIQSHTSGKNKNENNNISNTSINNDCVEASSSVKNTLYNFRSYLELVWKEKMTFIYYYGNVQGIKTKKYDIVTNKQYPGYFKHAWLSGTYLIVGHSVLTGVNAI